MSKSHQESAPMDTRLLMLNGELDIASNTAPFLASIEDDGSADLVIDMSQVTFMDCSGYRTIVAARLAHEARGGSLTVRCATRSTPVADADDRGSRTDRLSHSSSSKKSSPNDPR